MGYHILLLESLGLSQHEAGFSREEAHPILKRVAGDASLAGTGEAASQVSVYH